MLSGVRLERQVEQLTHLVGGRHQVVEALEVLARLGHGAHHQRDDDLGGHELTEGKIAPDHQDSADREQHRAGQDLQGERANRLPEHHLEVLAAASDIFGCQLVGDLEHPAFRAAGLEDVRIARDFFEPGHGLVLDAALLLSAANAAPDGQEDEQRNHKEEQDVEGQQQRVVEREQEQPNRHAQHERQAIE